jgi:biotin-[acetyl-CoA-carboxylase] ligase BirA-like protein
MNQFDLDRIQNATAIATLRHYLELDSTNDQAIRLLKRAPANESEISLPLLVLADRQTAGRGQFDRVWQSNEGSLTLTICVPANHEESALILPLVVGLSICNAIDRICTLAQPKLKWPNDILVNEHKLGGVLIERIASPTMGSHSSPDSISHSQPVWVIGVGLNVNQPVSCTRNHTSEDDDPSGSFEMMPISLLEVTGQPTKLSELTLELVNQILAVVAAIPVQPDWLLAACHRRMVFHDRALTLRTPNGTTIAGRYAGLGTSGELLVDCKGETVQVFSALVIRWSADGNEAKS